ncbi:hypothetical protein HPB50_019076 [Hyalomma asiaticum]|uniref:Uncharacterized protein n=1 Tax=Hyalomma asiaticum TaxID=266040 RepID=A0ACB7RK89_HYAAI|nr:hypothetical protein HPB50_019076 [Hyalomma asiaticum]
MKSTIGSRYVTQVISHIRYTDRGFSLNHCSSICHLSGEDARVAVRAPHLVGATVPDELRLRHAVPLLRHVVPKLLRQRFSCMKKTPRSA